MSIQEILRYPNPLLRKKSLPVEEFDEALQELAANMGETMYKAEGVGLAAPQIGVLKRIVIVDVPLADEETKRREFMALINPEIREGEGSVVGEEGCLSVLEYSTKVKRYQKIQVVATNLNGKPLNFMAEDRFARIIQHEMDHLDGKLFIDRISSLKRTLYKKKLKKILREEKK